MGSTSTQELLSRIRELEKENMELKSKLDQYQSIFNVDGGSGGGSGSGQSGSGGGSSEPRARRTNRAVGISAEPAMMRNLKDLTNQTFPEYKKSDR